MGIDTTSSSVDGHGETMEEELVFEKTRPILKGKPPFTIDPAGDLID